MIRQLKNPRFYVMLLGDTAAFALALTAAYLLRFEFDLSAHDWAQIAVLLPLSIPLKLAVFYCFRLYQGMWRYFTIRDLWRVAEASVVGSLVVVAAVAYLHRFQGFARSIFMLDGILSFLLCAGLRVTIRSFYASVSSSWGLQSFCLPGGRKAEAPGKSVLLIGAGGAGEKMLREIYDNPQLNYSVVGFLDDDPGKWGRSLHGHTVFGGAEALPEVAGRQRIDQLFICTPSATGRQMRRIVEVCKATGIDFKTLPAIGDIMDGKVSINALREVRFEDLLRRPPVELDAACIEQYVSGRRVLVTGVGSIGSELCRQLLPFNPAELILLDASELNLFSMEAELRCEHRFDRCRTVLGRVQDQALVSALFQTYRPTLVFHAAAYKHVPMIEQNPWEAIYNNVLGSRVVMETAIEHGAERFVLVSTDKAVRPTNVMGASKRLTELIMQALQNHGTRFMAVRFGNVVGSSGSVVPLFQRQIELGGPVTVTHPEVTRYFMMIPEAAQLILQAGGLGEGGEIFLLKMGAPVKIAQMAEDFIRLSGKEPGRDIEIRFTGLRPGEKLFEELITEGEGIVETRHDKIMVLKSNGGWNGQGTQQAFLHCLDRQLAELYRLARRHDGCAIRQKLKEVLPEYAPQEGECVLRALAGDGAGPAEREAAKLQGANSGAREAGSPLL